MRVSLSLAICVFAIGCSGDKPRVRPSVRSWMTGTISVTPTQDKDERGIHVKGQWPDGVDGLWIRCELHLTQDGSPDYIMLAETKKLAAFQRGGTGTSDYAHAPSFLRWRDPKKSYRAVFDYEIWKGEPTKGELLTKNCVFSADIEPSPAQ